MHCHMMIECSNLLHRSVADTCLDHHFRRITTCHTQSRPNLTSRSIFRLPPHPPLSTHICRYRHGNFRKCQTSTATPAEPGGLSW